MRAYLPNRVYVIHHEHRHDAEQPFELGLAPLPTGWYVISQGGCLIRLSKPFDTEAEAEAFAKKWTRKLELDRAARDARRSRP
jgi:hypothetical protein